MTRQFELLMHETRAVLDPAVGYNGGQTVRSFLTELRMGRVKLSDVEEVIVRLPFGDHVNPRTWATPRASEAFASLPELERVEIRRQIGMLAGNLKLGYPALVAEFPEQFN